GQVQIVVGAAQRSRSLELSCIEPRCELRPSLAGRLLIDRDPFCTHGANRECGGRLFMAGETSSPAEELRRRSLQKRNAALNRRPDIGQQRRLRDVPGLRLGSAALRASSKRTVSGLALSVAAASISGVKLR